MCLLFQYGDLHALLGNDQPRLLSAAKRDISDRQKEIEAAAEIPFYPYGRRIEISKLPKNGFMFGKRGQYVIPIPYEKREIDEVNPYSIDKREDELTGLEEYEASKRSGPYSMSGLRSLSFGKRDVLDPEKRDMFRSLAFGKRALGNSFTFGKRGMGLSSFNFGKRSGLGSSFNFGKRAVDRFEDGDDLMQDDKRALGNSFSFGKRVNGLSSFTFGKREDER